MTQIRQRSAGKAGRGDDAENVRAGQKQNTTSRADPLPLYKPVFARPPAVSPFAQARHAFNLIQLFVDDNWQGELVSAR